jgi:Uma2 family endonuclease
MATLGRPVSMEQFDAVVNALPEDFTAELIDGRIIVAPTPDGDHNEDVMSVSDQIRTALPDLRLYPECGLAVSAYRQSRARADGAVAPRGYFRGQKSWADASGVLMTVEVTSGSEKEAEVDRVEKRDAYAAAGIPIYLLVDGHRGEVVVYWKPASGRYTHNAAAVFGEKLQLPEPFNFELDTSELV